MGCEELFNGVALTTAGVTDSEGVLFADQRVLNSQTTVPASPTLSHKEQVIAGLLFRFHVPFAMTTTYCLRHFWKAKFGAQANSFRNSHAFDN